MQRIHYDQQPFSIYLLSIDLSIYTYTHIYVCVWTDLAEKYKILLLEKKYKIFVLRKKKI